MPPARGSPFASERSCDSWRWRTALVRSRMPPTTVRTQCRRFPPAHHPGADDLYGSGSGSGSGRIHDSTTDSCCAQQLLAFVLLLRPSGPRCISLRTLLAFTSPSSGVSFSASHFQLQAPDRPGPHSTSLAPKQKKSQTTLLDFVPPSIRLTSPFPFHTTFFINLPSASAF